MTDANQGRRRLDKILADSYLDDVSGVPIERLREMRQESQEEEGLLSYERRMLHGRLAILRAELERRRGDEGGSLIDALPSILADRNVSHRGAFPAADPRLEFQHAQRRVTKLVSDDTLANLASMGDAEVESVVERLIEAEAEVSETRKRLLAVVDGLNHELARRYRSGEADPNDVLSGR